jgi:hypothetical protein
MNLGCNANIRRVARHVAEKLVVIGVDRVADLTPTAAQHQAAAARDDLEQADNRGIRVRGGPKAHVSSVL